MNYEIDFHLDGHSHFRVTAGDITELQGVYAKMGGDPGWLVTRIKEAVSNLEAGTVAAPVADAHPDLAAAEQAAPAQAPQQDAWAANGPWNNSGGGAQQGQTAEKTDPWTGAPVSGGSPSAASTAPSGGTSAAGAHSSQDPWGNEYVAGLPGAPNCEGHGLPALRKNATSQSGNKYSAWVCPHAGPESADRSQDCKFFQFIGNKKKKN
jgi:hypothetical protein